ncbi:MULTISPECIES: hypothetical protein [Sutcliffiella]|uniref:Uncharacterized protein n=1 Tax=Sutcliffiella cohnii TaxID=33932 RepID=A0A223KWG4_9BACI|nr:MULTISPECIES: hypothetical protein [Sutcliffiella]AST93796.1 hypothetical protein BC6307_22230 [Sutcliffiella cohnii]WBL14987.1 hypothetical protein O1A01_24500 [Sutcliffiella sp. NC1]
MNNKLDDLDERLKSVPKPTLKLELKQKMHEKIISPKEAMTDKILAFLLSIIFIWIGFMITGNTVERFIFYPLDPLITNESIYKGITTLLTIIIILLVFILSYWLACKVSDYVTTFRWSFSIKVLLVLVLILLVSHKLFAPYFYTEQYLKSRAESVIQMEYDLYDENLSQEEFNKKAKKVYGMDRVLTDHYKRDVELIELNEISFERRYARFIYKVAVTEKVTINGKEELSTNIYKYEFYSKNGLFYLNGWSMN